MQVLLHLLATKLIKVFHDYFITEIRGKNPRRVRNGETIYSKTLKIKCGHKIKRQTERVEICEK